MGYRLIEGRAFYLGPDTHDLPAHLRASADTAEAIERDERQGSEQVISHIMVEWTDQGWTSLLVLE